MTDQQITESLRPIRDDLMLDSPPPWMSSALNTYPTVREEPAWQQHPDSLIVGAPDPRPAAWHYASRSKKESVAWLLWAGTGPLFLWFPVLDGYLRSFATFAVKLVIWLAGVTFLTIAVISAPPLGLSGESLWGTTISGALLWAFCSAALVLWWMVDALWMTPRLERVNNRLCDRIIGDFGADPHDLAPRF